MEQLREPRRVEQPVDIAAVEAGQEIDLLELLYSLLEKYKYILISAFVCTLIAGIYSFFIATPKYQATSSLYVVSSKNSAIDFSSFQIGSYLTSDFQEVFKTWELHEMVLRELNIDYTYEQLEKMLSISSPVNTRILNVTITADSALEARDLANTYANSARKFISLAMATEQPNILSVALAPVDPVSPRKMMNMILGFVIGALLAAGVITVQFIMDDKIKTTEDVMRYTGLPTFAIVPKMDDGSIEEKPNTRNKPKTRIAG
jgi:capsular polysaccharide biosynthesis protein